MATIQQADPGAADPQRVADRAASGSADPAAGVHQDVAVLFVHGIGDQAPAATLHDFGLPLIESAGDWLGADKVTACEIAPRIDAEPAHAYVTVQNGQQTLRFVAAESRWAAVFTPPGYDKLGPWLMSAGPFLAQRAFDGGLRRSHARMAEHGRNVRDGDLLTMASAALRFAGRLLWRPVQNLVAVTLSAIVLALLFVIGQLAKNSRARDRLLAPAAATGLAPAVWIERVAAWLARGATGTLVRYIGDSYALLNDEQARAQMVGRIMRDLDWLERHNPDARLVIVAHSQGAELARRVVSQRAAGRTPIASLITFGSGIKKLDAVDKLRGRRLLGWVAFGLRAVSAAALLLSVASVAGRLPLLGDLPAWAAAIGLPVTFAALTAGRKVLKIVVGDAYCHEDLGVTAAQLTRWLDLYASHDLVSEHTLPLDDLGDSHEIVNRRSLLLDHVVYPQNVEAFRAAVALELARVAGWPGVTTELPAKVGAAARQRAARVGWLVGARAAIVVAALAAIVLITPPVLVCVGLVAVTGALVVVGSRAWDRWSAAQTRKLLAACSR